AWHIPEAGHGGAGHPHMTALWGVGRALASEQADLWGGLIDLASGVEPQTGAGQLLNALVHSAREDQIALREDSVYVARLRRCHAPSAPLPLRFRHDATYLITGGLGGLGLCMAEWMIRHGARRLVLLGRSGLPARRFWSDVDPTSRNGRRIQAV